MNKKKRILFFLLVIEVLILFIFVYKNIQNYCNDENVLNKTFSFSELILKNGEMNEDYLYIDETYVKDVEIDEHGIICSYGPYMSLGKGDYKLTIEYEATEDGNYISLYSNQLLNEGFHLNRVNLSKDSLEAVLTFSLDKDISDFEIHTNYLGKGSFKVCNMFLEDSTITIKHNLYAIIAKTIFLFVVFSVFDIAVLYICKNPEESIYFIIFSMIGIFISSPAFLQYALDGHDAIIHVGRVYGIRDGLLDGEIFIKLQQNWLDSNGYIIGAFYGDFLLYIPAVLSLFGIKMQTAYQMFYIIINITNLLISYFCFKGIVKCEKIAAIGAVLYTCSIYRLMDMYLRHSVGEYCAFLFFPLIALGFYKVLSDEENERKDLNYGWLILSIAFAGLINTHILSCEMAAIFILVLLVIFFYKFENSRTIKYALLTIITTLLLSASFIVPFLDCMILKADTNVSSSERNSTFLLEDRGVVLSQFFELVPNTNGNSKHVSEVLTNEMPITLGLSYMIALGFSVIILFLLKDIKKSKKLIMYLCFSFLSLYMSTIYFPWDSFRKIPFLENAISSIQFPWRFLSVAGLFIVLAFMETLILCKDNNVLDKDMLKIVPIFTLLLTLISASIYLDGTNKRGDLLFFNNEDELKFMITGEEYLPLGTNPYIIEDKIINKGDAVISDYSKDGLKITFNVKSVEGSEIQVPFLYYWYYKCTLNDKEISLYKGDNNIVTISVPPNSEGEIEVFWENPILWNVSFVITFISAVIISVIIILKFVKYYFRNSIYGEDKIINSD